MASDRTYGKRILLVGVDPKTLNFYEDSIEKNSKCSWGEHFEINKCHTGKCAFRAVEEVLVSQYPYSVIFMEQDSDDAIEAIPLCRKIRKIDHDVNIVLVTSIDYRSLNDWAGRILPEDKFLCFGKPLEAKELHVISCLLFMKWRGDVEIRRTKTALDLQMDEWSYEIKDLMTKSERAISERRRIEKELWLKEESLGAIINNMPDIACLKDRDMRYLLVNKAFCAAVGRSADEIIGKKSLDVLPEKHTFIMEKEEKKVLDTGERSKVLISVGLYDGPEKWVEVIKTPLHDDKKNIVGTICTMRAFTEYQQKIVSLREDQASLAREIEERNSELSSLNKDLAESKASLDNSKKELAEYRKQLKDTKNALSILSEHMEEVSHRSEWRIIRKVRKMMIPVIERMVAKDELQENRAELDLLMACLNCLTSELVENIEVVSTLSSTELQVACLIKNGMTCEDIAHNLYISPSTVKTHRKNIRKKLHLQKTGIDLRTFLEKEMGSEMSAAGVAQGYVARVNG